MRFKSEWQFFYKVVANAHLYLDAACISKAGGRFENLRGRGREQVVIQ